MSAAVVDTHEAVVNTQAIQDQEEACPPDTSTQSGENPDQDIVGDSEASLSVGGLQSGLTQDIRTTEEPDSNPADPDHVATDAMEPDPVPAAGEPAGDERGSEYVMDAADLLPQQAAATAAEKSAEATWAEAEPSAATAATADTAAADLSMPDLEPSLQQEGDSAADVPMNGQVSPAEPAAAAEAGATNHVASPELNELASHFVEEVLQDATLKASQMLQQERHMESLQLEADAQEDDVKAMETTEEEDLSAAINNQAPLSAECSQLHEANPAEEDTNHTAYQSTVHIDVNPTTPVYSPNQEVTFEIRGLSIEGVEGSPPHGQFVIDTQSSGEQCALQGTHTPPSDRPPHTPPPAQEEALLFRDYSVETEHIEIKLVQSEPEVVHLDRKSASPSRAVSSSSFDGEPVCEDMVNVQECTQAYSQVPNEGVPSQEVPIQEVPSQEVPIQEVPNQEVPNQGVPSQEVPNQEVPNQGVPRQEVPIQEVPMQEVPNQEVPSKEVSSLRSRNQNEVPETEMPTQQETAPTSHTSHTSQPSCFVLDAFRDMTSESLVRLFYFLMLCFGATFVTIAGELSPLWMVAFVWVASNVMFYVLKM